MNLRLRLGLASAALALPLLVTLTWLRVEAAARAEEDVLVQRVRQLMDTTERARCELNPARWSDRRSAPPPPPSRLPAAGDMPPGPDGDEPGPGGPRGGGPRGGGPMGGGPMDGGPMGGGPTSEPPGGGPPGGPVGGGPPGGEPPRWDRGALPASSGRPPLRPRGGPGEEPAWMALDEPSPTEERSPYGGPGHWRGPFGGRRPDGEPERRSVPAELFPYDERLQSEVSGAPGLAPTLIEGVRSGEAVVVHRGLQSDIRVLDVVIRSPGLPTGPCAFVLVRRHSGSVGSAVKRQLPGGLWPAGLVVGVMVFGLGPVVRRIVRLAKQVRASAQAGYATRVDESGGDELTDLARSFNEAASEVRQQIEAQQQREGTLRAFVDNTTHDLMTPLTVLTGHLVDLADAARAGSAAPRPVVEAALGEAHYIGSLLHNLGAAARLEAGEPQMRRDEVALGALVERAVLRLRPIARLRQVELEHAVPPDPITVVGDVTLLEQAVSNVVQNAVKHNHPGGHVAVVLERTPTGFSLDVIDDGPGIAEADRERLLRPRERGDSARSRDPDGQGLGLAIARRVSDAHGWTMTLERSEFGGLQVRFAGGRVSTGARISLV